MAPLELLSHSIKPLGIDPYGAIEKARITVRGKLSILQLSDTTWETHVSVCIRSKRILFWLNLKVDRRKVQDGHDELILCLQITQLNPDLVATKAVFLLPVLRLYATRRVMTDLNKGV
ncbi:hypothetical protein MMC31_004380 [Peltigera leucophlebia]|nr:hypothetical protein [Peltigera leucophlebia]